MRRLQGVVVLVTVAILLGACQTVPPKEYKQVSADNILAPELLEPGPGTGVLILKRDAGFTGMACAVRFWIDGREVVRLRQSQAVTLHIPAGEIILGANPASPCGGGLQEALVVISPDRPRAYRFGSGSAMNTFLLPTSPD